MTVPAILACKDAFAPRTRLDAPAVAELMRRQAPPLTMHVVDDLCARPDLLRTWTADDGRRLVLGVCSRDVAVAETQQWSRRAGLDPFAVEWVPLSFAAAVARDDRARGQETAALQLAASSARLVAFPGSEPEHLRVRFAQGSLSRRAVLTLPPFVYEPVARVDQDACLGGERCGLCLSTCPSASISVVEGEVHVDRGGCVACGVCVSRCPIGAITLPTGSLGQYEAQLRAVLARPGSLTAPVGILIGCRHAGGALDAVPGSTSTAVVWIPIEVPSLGMVTAGWFLQALAASAVAVAVLACPDGVESCGLVGERVDFCREVLRSLGYDADAPAGVVRQPDRARKRIRLPALRTPGRPGARRRPVAARARGDRAGAAQPLSGGAAAHTGQARRLTARRRPNRAREVYRLRCLRVRLPDESADASGTPGRGVASARPGRLHRLSTLCLRLPGTGGDGTRRDGCGGTGYRHHGTEDQRGEQVPGVRRPGGAGHDDPAHSKPLGRLAGRPARCARHRVRRLPHRHRSVVGREIRDRGHSGVRRDPDTIVGTPRIQGLAWSKVLNLDA